MTKSLIPNIKSWKTKHWLILLLVLVILVLTGIIIKKSLDSFTTSDIYVLELVPLNSLGMNIYFTDSNSKYQLSNINDITFKNAPSNYSNPNYYNLTRSIGLNETTTTYPGIQVMQFYSYNIQYNTPLLLTSPSDFSTQNIKLAIDNNSNYDNTWVMIKTYKQGSNDKAISIVQIPNNFDRNTGKLNISGLENITIPTNYDSTKNLSTFRYITVKFDNITLQNPTNTNLPPPDLTDLQLAVYGYHNQNKINVFGNPCNVNPLGNYGSTKCSQSLTDKNLYLFNFILSEDAMFDLNDNVVFEISEIILSRGYNYNFTIDIYDCKENKIGSLSGNQNNKIIGGKLNAVVPSMKMDNTLSATLINIVSPKFTCISNGNVNGNVATTTTSRQTGGTTTTSGQTGGTTTTSGQTGGIPTTSMQTGGTPTTSMQTGGTTTTSMQIGGTPTTNGQIGQTGGILNTSGQNGGILNTSGQPATTLPLIFEQQLINKLLANAPNYQSPLPTDGTDKFAKLKGISSSFQPRIVIQ